MTPTEMRKPARGARRSLIVLAAFMAIGLALLYLLATPTLAKAQKPSESEVSLQELMKTGPLPEMTMGSDKAPNTLIEYSSMTCPHCARFHNEVLPALKKDYIDTGRVRYIIREFPLDDLAAAAFMLARCSGPEKYFPFVDVLYARQDNWAFTAGSPVPKLKKLAKQAGMSEKRFKACLTDQKLLDGILWVRERGSKSFGVNSTPTFFLNGKKLVGGQDVSEFAKHMKP